MKNRMKTFYLFLIGALLGMFAGGGITLKKSIKEEIKWKRLSDKHLDLFLLMNQWVKIKQEGKSLASYFMENRYKKIAIYGMGYAGERLLEELRGSEIEVLYGIDKNVNEIDADIKIFSPDDSPGNVDALVVTPIFFMNEIKEMMSKKLDCPVIPLDDILYGM